MAKAILSSEGILKFIHQNHAEQNLARSRFLTGSGEALHQTVTKHNTALSYQTKSNKEEKVDENLGGV